MDVSQWLLLKEFPRLLEKHCDCECPFPSAPFDCNCWKNTEGSLNVHFHLDVFAHPVPVHFFPPANLLVFQRENKGMRAFLCIPREHYKLSHFIKKSLFPAFSIICFCCSNRFPVLAQDGRKHSPTTLRS